jgi:hypothetical protein
VWRDAIAVVAEERAPARSCFLYREYQHFNMPWASLDNSRNWLIDGRGMMPSEGRAAYTAKIEKG